MKTSSAKQKGKSFEKDIVSKIKEAFNLSADDIRVNIGNETGSDVNLSAKAKARFPYSIECKRRARMDTLYGFYEQAKRHYPELVPAVVLRADRKEPLILLNFDYFLTRVSKNV